MAASLSDDVLREIFLRLKDAATLFRCATACWRWRGLVADPTFLRRRWPENACPSLAGFLIKNPGRDQRTKVLVPTPQSALGRRCRALGSFVPAVPPSVPLASRRGLLLVRLVPPREADLDQTVLHLAVCNLILGTCDTRPPRACSSVGYNDYGCHCCAVLSGDDCRCSSDDERPPGDSSFYKVLVVTAGHESQLRFDVHTFSSDIRSWSTKRSRETMGADTSGSFCQTDAVVCRGIAYWLFRDDAVGYFDLVKLNGQNGHLTCLWLPAPRVCECDQDHRPCLSLASDGTLSMLQMQETGSQLEIWRQKEDQPRRVDVSEWLCTQTIELIQPSTKKTQGKDMLYILGEKCGKLLVMDGRGRVYTADLETRAMKEVADWPHARSNSPLEAVLLEMDWPAFFVSRLGTISGEADTRRQIQEGRYQRRGRYKTADRGK